MKASHPLLAGLEQRLRSWRRGMLRASWLQLGGAIVLALVAAGLIDLLLPLPESVRIGFLVALGIGALGFACRRWIAARRLGARDMAVRGDDMQADRRRSLLTAYELRERGDAGFLAGKNIADAQLGFLDLEPRRFVPKSMLRAGLGVLVAALALALVLAAIHPRAAATVVARLLAPGADVPPYSSLEFAVDGDMPRVVYGDDLEVSATIEGNVTRPVYLLTRHAGKVESVECFRGAGNTFSQRIEKVTQPIEFAFATGHARSRWRKIELLLEPRFALSRFAMTPPAYTGRERTEMILGAEEVRAVEGTRGELVVTSNRPLSRGEAVIEPASGGEAVRVRGEVTGVHTAVFRWDMLEPARVTVRIFDTRGTECPEPLEIAQRVAPDGKPHIAIVEPGPVSLATPSGVVRAKLSARDDFGLRRVALIRSMPGLRERSRVVGPHGDGDRFESEIDFDLAELGVKPGDTIELRGEARDHNPSLSGLSVADAAVVQIISEETYRQKLRDDITLEEFAARYALAEEKMQGLAEALDALEAAEGEADRQSALDAAARAADEVADLYAQLGEDLAVYDVEQGVNAEFRRMAGVARDIDGKLGELTPGAPDFQSEARALANSLRGEREELVGQFQRMDEFIEIARVMELAAEFVVAAEAQAGLARDFERSAQPGAPDLETLAAAGFGQERVADGVGSFADRLRAAADRLSEIDPALQRDALEFADALEASGTVGAMQSALTGVKNQDAPRAAAQGAEARDRMKGLLPEPGDDPSGNCFGDMCRGLFPRGGGMEESLSQCFGAMLGRGRQGIGGGMVGSAEDGYAMAGQSPWNIPVYGSPRMRFNKPANTPSVSSSRSLRDGLTGGAEEAVDAEGVLVGHAENADPSDAAAVLRGVPEKYRSAVRRYFSIEDSEP